MHQSFKKLNPKILLMEFSEDKEINITTTLAQTENIYWEQQCCSTLRLISTIQIREDKEMRSVRKEFPLMII